VLYIAAEGAWTLKPRVRAWKHAHDYWGRRTPLRYWGEPVNLLAGRGELMNGAVLSICTLIRIIEQERIQLVIVDTLAASMIGGDEDSARDMSIVTASLTELRRAGAAVLLVHHTGKNDKAERGSVALRGSADTMMKLESRGGGDLVLLCDKQRNCRPFSPIPLRTVDIQPPVGPPSCVIVEATASLGDADLPVTGGALTLLRFLIDQGSHTRGDLDRLAGLKPRSVGRYLGTLRKRGLVDVRPSPDDGREKLNYATDAGCAAIAGLASRAM
jgi:hypothetical protein